MVLKNCYHTVSRELPKDSEGEKRMACGLRELELDRRSRERNGNEP
jgi:hypothetical protein